jgi:hypothetical protein
VDAVSGLYCLERVGVDHVLKQQVHAYLKHRNFTAENFIGFDLDRPAPLNDSRYRNEKFALLTSALNTAYLSSRVGIQLGGSNPNSSSSNTSSRVTEGGVLAHVRYLRPYVLPSASFDHDDWVDQITMVPHAHHQHSFCVYILIHNSRYMFNPPPAPYILCLNMDICRDCI